MYESDIDLIYVQKQLAEHFDLSGLKTLCFDIGIDYEDLAGDTKTDKARELVKFVYRTGRIPEILKHCQELRPHVDWNRPAEIYKHDELPDEWVEPLQRLYRLVKEFNRNRQLPFTDERTRQGDEIAFKMREAAPFLFNRFDIGQWIDSSNIGKRLAAIKYLDWLQDIEFLENLLGKLVTERPFMQLHTLVTIYSMLDQLGDKYQKIVQLGMTAYQIRTRGDQSLEYWRERIIARLR